MALLPGQTEPFWTATAARAAFPSLSHDLKADVAVVGGGIAGLTAAYLLTKAGRKVAVLEALQIGGQATGRSTAKITSQHNLIYSTLVKDYGEDSARLYGEANQAALEWICALVRDSGLACDLERKNAYVIAISPDHREKIEKEAEIAQRLGLPASFTRETSLPFAIAGAVRFDNQAQFHPSNYLIGLARLIVGQGGEVFEHSRVTKVDSENAPIRVETESGIVTASEVIVATHMPIVMEGKFFAKAYPYAHPMAAVRIESARAPDGMFITIDQPTLSLRTAKRDGSLYLMAVGGPYRTGHAEDAAKVAGILAQTLERDFGASRMDYHWTNEDFMSMDGLPFIGRASKDSEHLFVATGFSAWGMTNGTAAGMVLADTILGRANPWATLFDATRVKAIQGGTSFLKENLDVAAHLAGGYLRRDRKSVDELQAGEAAVFKADKEHVAAYRDETGELHAVSAVCTHMGCIVGWNPIDRTWDCPCHGSRFTLEGTVINGPAITPLRQ